MNIIYLHGLSSSGNSNTANQLRKLFHNDNVITPDIPVRPSEALEMLRQLVKDKTNKDSVIIGTSMGAMYAQQITGFNRILVNPAFHVSELLRETEGKILPFFSQRQNGETEFLVTSELCEEFEEMESRQFDNSNDEDEVIALFGQNDDVCNCMDECENVVKYYHIFDGVHRMTDEVIQNVLQPIIKWMKNFHLPEPGSQPLKFEDVTPGDTGKYRGKDGDENLFKVYQKGIGRKWFDFIKTEYNGQTIPDGRVFDLQFPELPKRTKEEDVELILGNRYLMPPSVECYGKDGIQVFNDCIFYIDGLKIQVF